MPKLDCAAIPQTNATGYPPPFDAAVEGRWYRRLAPAAGLWLETVANVRQHAETQVRPVDRLPEERAALDRLLSRMEELELATRPA